MKPALPALRETLSCVLSERPNRACTRRFVHHCHRIAEAYLLTRARFSSLDTARLGISLSDLALDCIAGLFRRDNDGRFVKLIAYYHAQRWHLQDEETLTALTRRLVLSQTAQGLFKRYRQVDPSLSRIIRNLKLTIDKQERLRLEKRGGDLWLVLNDGVREASTGSQESEAETFDGQAHDGQAHDGQVRDGQVLDGQVLDGLDGQALDPSYLEGYLTRHIREPFNLGELVGVVAELLGQRPDRAYPLSSLAMVLRAATVRINTSEVDHGESRWNHFRAEEVHGAIAASVAQTKGQVYGTYVGRGKVEEALFEAYLRAVEKKLSVEYGSANAGGVSHYEALVEEVPGLGYETYRTSHRKVFEYIYKLCHKRLVEILQKS